MHNKILINCLELQSSKYDINLCGESYLDKEPQVDILGLRLGPVDLTILFVGNIDALEGRMYSKLSNMLKGLYSNRDFRRFYVC